MDNPFSHVDEKLKPLFFVGNFFSNPKKYRRRKGLENHLTGKIFYLRYASGESIIIDKKSVYMWITYRVYEQYRDLRRIKVDK